MHSETASGEALQFHCQHGGNNTYKYMFHLRIEELWEVIKVKILANFSAALP